MKTLLLFCCCFWQASLWAYPMAADTSQPSMLRLGGIPPNLLKKLIYYNQHFNETQYSDTLTLAELDSVRYGDIILRHGKGAVSALFADLLNEPNRLTHSGFIFKDSSHTEWQVIHAQTNADPKSLQGAIQIEPLSHFVQDAVQGSIVVVRVKGVTELDAKRYLQVAKNWMKKQPPFDYFFDTEDSQRLYCSEFIRCTLNRVYNREMMPLRTTVDIYTLISMSNFFHPDVFEIVFSHIPTDRWPTFD